MMILCNFYRERVRIFNFYPDTYSILVFMTIYYSVPIHFTGASGVFGTEDGYNRITVCPHNMDNITTMV